MLGKLKEKGKERERKGLAGFSYATNTARFSAETDGAGPKIARELLFVQTFYLSTPPKSFFFYYYDIFLTLCPLIKLPIKNSHKTGKT